MDHTGVAYISYCYCLILFVKSYIRGKMTFCLKTYKIIFIVIPSSILEVIKKPKGLRETGAYLGYHQALSHSDCLETLAWLLQS